MLVEVATEMGDDPALLICLYQDCIGGYARIWDVAEAPPIVRCSLDELPDQPMEKRKPEYYRRTDGSKGIIPPGEDDPSGRPIIAFSERYVYIRQIYDHHSGVKAVPRHPESATFIPWIGG
ncbi:MAG: hypothetical protein Q7R41_08290 [Phycisphaerales bacterium]|nr:hypothetical protein [Phycisphaerales bacterium]